MTQGKGTVVITGAGSGIGRALTALCAERGYDLVLYDINGEELESSAETARAKGVKVAARVLDVADEGAINQAAEEVAQEQGAIRMLFNNAGVALGGLFEDYTPEEYKWLMDINFYGVVNMSRAFLPLLRKYEGKAQLVNVSSVFGIIAPEGQTAYSAAKFAVRGFSEALRHELEGSNVGVTVVHPGGVATNIAKRARVSDKVPKEQHEIALKRAEKSLSMPPPRAAEIILNAAERGDGRILVGTDARILTAITRAFPIHYWKILKAIPGLRPPERQQ
ncbi:SDR family NAD(P)-dependent oxidoreductase [Parvularcula lutaonensis]|uniref:SDR family NAD(P)-dependent oxidoreductase n=1 Tax=Parvularcula lutaonensis TaxID=491923 RepID=A0ABV7MB13_9PROT|nr:SDR family NAD(P)-dependent oxidoreductase [Parvularcula lutaonensis]GGY39503.1 short-chain dehydrogenase [Parvularcula lutaonensis]